MCNTNNFQFFFLDFDNLENLNLILLNLLGLLSKVFANSGNVVTKIFLDKFVYHKPRAQEEELVSGLFSKWTSAIGNEKLKTDMKSNVLLTAEKTIYYFFTAKVQQNAGVHYLKVKNGRKHVFFGQKTEIFGYNIIAKAMANKILANFILSKRCPSELSKIIVVAMCSKTPITSPSMGVLIACRAGV